MRESEVGIDDSEIPQKESHGDVSPDAREDFISTPDPGVELRKLSQDSRETLGLITEPSKGLHDEGDELRSLGPSHGRVHV